MTEEVVVYCDGGVWPNPGPYAYAGVVGDRDGAIVVEQVRNGGHGSNNEAEYMALILGATLAHLVGARIPHFVVDSQLVARQVAGWYAIRSLELGHLHARAQALLMEFDRWTIKAVPRAQNRRADWLCNTLIRPQDKRALKEPPALVEFSTDGYERVGWVGVGSSKP